MHKLMHGGHNPGLPGRFFIKITFPDYDPHELLEIAERMVLQKGRQLHEIARSRLRDVTLAKKLPSNARGVELILEAAIRASAIRTRHTQCASEGEILTELITLLAEDFF